MLQIDLGCGTNKQQGFIGVDRFPLRGVDVVADMNGPLPFRAGSVDLLVASHSLEHVKDLLATMREIWRICRHGAQLCVIAPYSEQKLNLANPYHSCVFNEHTPRFWTSHPVTPVDPEEYAHPHAKEWGLSLSDHSDPGIDIRLVCMEFFYFPQFAGLSHSEQRRLRQERVDVCDQIMYHLIIWKEMEPSPDKSFDMCAAEFRPYEPEYIKARRDEEREMLPQQRTPEFNDTHSSLARLEGELRSRLQDAASAAGSSPGADQLTADLERHRVLLYEENVDQQQQRAGLAAALDECLDLRSQLLEAKTYFAATSAEILKITESRAAIAEQRQAAFEQENRTLRDESARTLLDLALAQETLRRELSALAEAQAEVSSYKQQVRSLQAALETAASHKAKLALTRAELETANILLGMLQQKERTLARELAVAREESAAATHDRQHWETLWDGARNALSGFCSEIRVVPPAYILQAGSFVIGRNRTKERFPSSFIPVRQYCVRHFPGASRASLMLSGDLGDMPYREYLIPFEPERYTTATLAVRPMLPGSSGSVGVEIVSSRSEVVAQVLRPLAKIDPAELTKFSLPVPVANLGKPWWLRVFVRDAVAPVVIYELARTSLLRGATQFFPFVVFE